MCHVLTSLDHTTTYGISRQCPLNQLIHYHVCDYGLPPDVMHDLLEGYVPYTLKLMLSHFISTVKLLSFDQLNSAIVNFDYGYAVSSGPHSLAADSLSLCKGCTTFPLTLSGRFKNYVLRDRHMITLDGLMLPNATRKKEASSLTYPRKRMRSYASSVLPWIQVSLLR